MEGTELTICNVRALLRDLTIQHDVRSPTAVQELVKRSSELLVCPTTRVQMRFSAISKVALRACPIV